MNINLYDKIVEALDELREHTKYGASAGNYKVTLIPGKEIFMFDGSEENKLLEFRDDGTIIDVTGYDRFSKDKSSRTWKDIVDTFADGLEERLGQRVYVWDKHRLYLFEKVKEAVEDLRKGPDHERIVRDYHVTPGSEGQIYVYDSGIIIFEVKNENKVIDKRDSDPIWNELVGIFVGSLEKKLEHKVKTKKVGFEFSLCPILWDFAMTMVTIVQEQVIGYIGEKMSYIGKKITT